MRLAEWMMKLIHGEEALNDVREASNFLFQNQLNANQIDDKMLEILCKNERIIYAKEQYSIGQIIEQEGIVTDYGN